MKAPIPIEMILIAVLVSGCMSAAQAPAYSPTPNQGPATSTPSELAPFPTASGMFSATSPAVTLEPTATLTRTPEDTTTPSPSPTLADTPTITPSPTPEGLVPGLYALKGCAKLNLTGILWVDWCVINAEVRRDGNMAFLVSWTPYVGTSPWIKVYKYSNQGSQNQYLTDEYDNRYVLIDVGGDAGRNFKVSANETFYGILVYPPPKPHSRRFTLHDSDFGVTIEDLWMLNGKPIWDELLLKFYPITLDYKLEKWAAAASESEGGSLTHLLYEKCRVYERPPAEIRGKYKNTIAIGPYTYKIYGWLEGTFGVREYLITEGLETNSPVLLHTDIPLDQSLECLADISEVLADLYLTK